MTEERDDAYQRYLDNRRPTRPPSEYTHDPDDAIDVGEDMPGGVDDDELGMIARVMRLLSPRSQQSQSRILRYLYSRIVKRDIDTGLPF